jgi:hypothetical protein
VPGRRVLLADDGVPRPGPAQLGADQLLGGPVGVADGGEVGLVLDGEVGRVEP